MNVAPMSEADIRFNLIVGNWWVDSCGEYWKILHIEWPKTNKNQSVSLIDTLMIVATSKDIVSMSVWYFMGLMQNADANGNYPRLRV